MVQVDVRDILKVSKRLRNAHRSTFPVAVRSTLNDMAYDVKTNHLLPVLKAKSGMTIRSESFFKRYSGFKKASGFEIASMFSQVGMIPAGDASKAVDRLDEQDVGGTLKHAQVPLYASRRGKSHKKRVQNKLFWQKIKIAATVPYGDKQGLIRAVTKTRINHAGGDTPTGVVYGNILYGIRGFKRVNSQNKIKLHLTRLYSFEKNRKVTVKPHRFMEKSAILAGVKIQSLFNTNLEKQFKRQGL